MVDKYVWHYSRVCQVQSECDIQIALHSNCDYGLIGDRGRDGGGACECTVVFVWGAVVAVSKYHWWRECWAFADAAWCNEPRGRGSVCLVFSQAAICFVVLWLLVRCWLRTPCHQSSGRRLHCCCCCWKTDVSVTLHVGIVHFLIIIGRWQALDLGRSKL